MNKLWENIFKRGHKKKNELDTILLKIPVFQGLNHRELRKIKCILHQREYVKEEVIFHQEDI